MLRESQSTGDNETEIGHALAYLVRHGTEWHWTEEHGTRCLSQSVEQREREKTGKTGCPMSYSLDGLRSKEDYEVKADRTGIRGNRVLELFTDIWLIPSRPTDCIAKNLCSTSITGRGNPTAQWCPLHGSSFCDPTPPDLPNFLPKCPTPPNPTRSADRKQNTDPIRPTHKDAKSWI